MPVSTLDCHCGYRPSPGTSVGGCCVLCCCTEHVPVSLRGCGPRCVKCIAEGRKVVRGTFG